MWGTFFGLFEAQLSRGSPPQQKTSPPETAHARRFSAMSKAVTFCSGSVSGWSRALSSPSPKRPLEFCPQQEILPPALRTQAPQEAKRTGQIEGVPNNPITLIDKGRIHYRDTPQQQTLEDWNEFWSEYKNA